MRSTTRLLAVSFCAAVAIGVGGPEAPLYIHAQSQPDGAAIFTSNCATCHDGAAASRAPSRDVLHQRSPEAILSALTAGGMRPQGGRLSGPERRAVAEFLSGRPLGGDITGATTGRCAATSATLPNPSASAAWTGWSPEFSNTRFQSAKNA